MPEGAPKFTSVHEDEARHFTPAEIETAAESLSAPERQEGVHESPAEDAVQDTEAEASQLAEVRERLGAHAQEAAPVTPEGHVEPQQKEPNPYEDPNFEKLLNEVDPRHLRSEAGTIEGTFRSALSNRIYNNRLNRQSAASITGAAGLGTAIGVSVMTGSAFAFLPAVALAAGATGLVWGGMKLAHSLKERSLLKKGRKYFPDMARPQNY